MDQREFDSFYDLVDPDDIECFLRLGDFRSFGRYTPYLSFMRATLMDLIRKEAPGD